MHALRGLLVHDIIAPLLSAGPHGLYGTAALIVLCLPLGYLYAYVSYVGYKQTGVTRPSEARRKTAIGGAVIFAVCVVLYRHALTIDWRQSYERALPALWSLIMMPIQGVSSYVATQTEQAPHFVARLFWAIVSGIAIPGTVGLMFGLFIVLAIGAGLLLGGVIAAGFAGLFAALVAAAGALPGFLLGVPIVLYFWFVRLPMQVVYLRARREGRWPTGAEMRHAIASATINKNVWQSEIMEYKARRFASQLRRERLNR